MNCSDNIPPIASVITLVKFLPIFSNCVESPLMPAPIALPKSASKFLYTVLYVSNIKLAFFSSSRYIPCADSTIFNCTACCCFNASSFFLSVSVNICRLIISSLCVSFATCNLFSSTFNCLSLVVPPAKPSKALLNLLEAICFCKSTDCFWK